MVTKLLLKFMCLLMILLDKILYLFIGESFCPEFYHSICNRNKNDTEIILIPKFFLSFVTTQLGGALSFDRCAG